MGYDPPVRQKTRGDAIQPLGKIFDILGKQQKIVGEWIYPSPEKMKCMNKIMDFSIVIGKIKTTAMWFFQGTSYGIH